MRVVELITYPTAGGRVLIISLSLSFNIFRLSCSYWLQSAQIFENLILNRTLDYRIVSKVVFSVH